MCMCSSSSSGWLSFKIETWPILLHPIWQIVKTLWGVCNILKVSIQTVGLKAMSIVLQPVPLNFSFNSGTAYYTLKKQKGYFADQGIFARSKKSLGNGVLLLQSCIILWLKDFLWAQREEIVILKIVAAEWQAEWKWPRAKSHDGLILLYTSVLSKHISDKGSLYVLPRFTLQSRIKCLLYLQKVPYPAIQTHNS